MVTFLEDSLRILTQWSDQLVYLRDYRKSKLDGTLLSYQLNPDPALARHGSPMRHVLSDE